MGGEGLNRVSISGNPHTPYFEKSDSNDGLNLFYEIVDPFRDGLKIGESGT